MPGLELVRQAIPRRVHTRADMDVTAESVIEVAACAIPGLRSTHEPKMLRFLMGRFEEV